MCSIRFNVLIDDSELVSAEFRRDAKILDLNGVRVVTETRNLVSVATCRIFRQVRLEGNREVSPKFRGDAKILDLRADSVVKNSLITADGTEIAEVFQLRNIE